MIEEDEVGLKEKPEDTGYVTFVVGYIWRQTSEAGIAFRLASYMA